MPIALYLTIVWSFIAMLALGVAKYHKMPFPKIAQQRNVLLLILEVLAITIAIYFNNRTNSSPYNLITAIFLLLVGWVKSHQNLLLRIFRGGQNETMALADKFTS